MKGRKDRELLPLAGFLKCPQQLRLGQAITRSLGLSLSHPHGWLDILTLAITCYLLAGTSGRSWNWEQSQDLNPGTLMWDVCVSSSILTSMPNVPLLNVFTHIFFLLPSVFENQPVSVSAYEFLGICGQWQSILGSLSFIPRASDLHCLRVLGKAV